VRGEHEAEQAVKLCPELFAVPNADCAKDSADKVAQLRSAHVDEMVQQSIDSGPRICSI
jgi:hypothetical protein